MKDCGHDTEDKGIGFFERYLTVWVLLCIVAGIALGKVAPGVALAGKSVRISLTGRYFSLVIL